MKLIIAIIGPEKLSLVQAALSKERVHLMTVSEVLDCDPEHTSVEIYRGRQVRRPLAKLRLEVAVDTADFDSVVSAIQSSLEAAPGGECRTFVMGLDERKRLSESAPKPRTEESSRRFNDFALVGSRGSKVIGDPRG
jgi:nitrogen regulatory protein PII